MLTLVELVLVVCGVLCFTECNGDGIFGMNAEEKLFHDILERYKDPAYVNVRPVKNHTEILAVDFGLGLIHVNHFNAETGEAEFRFWDKLYWRDSRIVWNPEHYDMISTMRVPLKYIWRPDLMTYNSITTKYDDNSDEVLAVVSSDGAVIYIPPFTRHTVCNVTAHGNSNNQKVKCPFIIGSWAYDGFHMDLDLYNDLHEIDLTYYTQHKHLKVVSTSAEKKLKYYDCCPEPYPSLEFYIEFLYKI